MRNWPPRFLYRLRRLRREDAHQRNEDKHTHHTFSRRDCPPWPQALGAARTAKWYRLQQHRLPVKTETLASRTGRATQTTARRTRIQGAIMAARTSAFSAALSTIEQGARALRVSESAKLVRLFPAPPGIQPKKLRAARTPQTPPPTRYLHYKE